MDKVNPADVGMSAERLERVRKHFKERYIDPGKITCASTLVSRRGKLCYLDVQGLADRERNKPMAEDTIVRIYSMTKPITSLAIMMLYEQAKLSLDDPVHRYIPSFKNLQVFKSGSYPLFLTEPVKRHMTIRDLLLHMSGLTYDFLRMNNLDAAYRKKKIHMNSKALTNETLVEALSELPLLFSPGERWNYSFSTDVLGRVIEVVSGMGLGNFFQQHIFSPLDMTDTGFCIPEDKASRFAACYHLTLSKELVLQDDPENSSFASCTQESGGGGLISTLHDYHQFCLMLLNGGALNGHQLVGPRTLQYMMQNHLPNGSDLAPLASGSFSETRYEGIGFGLGFATTLDTTKNGVIGSRGEVYWGGLASTRFWLDPKEELIVIFFTQCIPATPFDFHGQLHSLIYSSIID